MRYTLLITLVISMFFQAGCSKLISNIIGSSDDVVDVAVDAGRLTAAGRLVDVIDARTLDLITGLSDELNKSVNLAAKEATISLIQKNLKGDELFIEATRQTAEQSIHEMAVLFKNSDIGFEEAVKYAENIPAETYTKTVLGVMSEQGEEMSTTGVGILTQRAIRNIKIRAIVFTAYGGNSNSE